MSMKLACMTLLLIPSSSSAEDLKCPPYAEQPWTLDSFSALTSLTELRVSLNRCWEFDEGFTVELAESLTGVLSSH